MYMVGDLFQLWSDYVHGWWTVLAVVLLCTWLVICFSCGLIMYMVGDLF